MNVLQLFGLARLPVDADKLIRPQDRTIIGEHLWCSITWINFQSSHRASLWKRQWFAGSLAFSRDRLIAFRGRSRLINLPFDDPKFRDVTFVLEGRTLIISHDAGLFRDDWSGSIEYRFRLPTASPVFEHVQQITDAGRSAVVG